MRLPPERPGTPPTQVEDVIDRMQQIAATLPTGDGVRAFNEMYLLTTQQVSRAIDTRTFADPAFMARLDVVFADLYLDALRDNAANPRRVPRCWRVLFEARGRPAISLLQFAIAGMNAHINHDLALALVRTAAEFGGDLDSAGPWRADYLVINRVLAQTQPIVKRQLLVGPVAEVDRALGDEDDRVSLWGIERAREFAWSTAEALWAVRGTPVETGLTSAVDRAVELSSKLILGATR
jgi:hypothetical protein